MSEAGDREWRILKAAADEQKAMWKLQQKDSEMASPDETFRATPVVHLIPSKEAEKAPRDKDGDGMSNEESMLDDLMGFACLIGALYNQVIRAK